MADSNTQTQRMKMVAAKLTGEDSALLNRACARLSITRSEAVQLGVRRILDRQRVIER